MAKKPKTKLLQSKEIDRVLTGFKWEIRENPVGKTAELIEKKLKDALSIAVVKHMLNESYYVFDEDYLNEFQYGDKDWDDFDDDYLVVNHGEFNPVEFSTIYDFVSSSSDDYDCWENWGETTYREISIESKIIMDTMSEFNIIKPLLIEELKSINTESILDFVTVNKVYKVKYSETRQHKVTKQKTDSIVTKTELKETEEYPSDILSNICISDVIIKVLDYIDDEYFCQEFIEEINMDRFKDLYLRGCELLNHKDTFYKKIFFKGQEKENFLFEILNESVKNNSLVDYNGKAAEAKSLVSYYKMNQFSSKGFSEGFIIDNETNIISEAVEYIRNRIIGKWLNHDEILEHLKLLSAIYAYQSKDSSLDKLKEMFKYDFLRNTLLDTGIMYIEQVLYNKCKVYDSMKNTLPIEPKDYYPLSRKLKRHFVLHVGPTNSGKTYQSLEKFKKKNSGVYLAPLRLLALEVQEKMLADGFKCSLVTGEEEHIVDESNHICCTIEKLDFSKKYDIAIIDEAQMLDDSQRGSAWTSAILGVAANEIHVCFAQYAQEMIMKLIKYCGDTYEIVIHDRDTNLILSSDSFDFLKDLQKGDAIVAFSKRKVLNIAAAINTKTNLSCSVLFGSLPYGSRKRQFQNFAERKSDVLITTDAVGMGVNLAIRRIVFMEDSKYDGRSMRKLKTSEILQIAGRAGRKNIYDQGYVVVTDESMKRRYEDSIKPITEAYVGLTHHLVEIDGDLEDVIFAWQQLEFESPFIKADISNQISILNEISHINLRKSDRFKAIFMPINTKSSYEMCLLKHYLKAISENNNHVNFPHIPNIEYGDELKQLESYSKGIDIYYSFCKTYGLELDVEKVEQEREVTCNKINKLLLSSNLEVPRCNVCGEELEWDYDRYRCSDCYSGRGYRGNRWYNDDDEDDWDDMNDYKYI